MDIEKQKQFLIRFVYWTVIFVLIYGVIGFGLPLIMPFVIAFVIAYILSPLIQKVAKKIKIKQSIAAIFIVVCFYSICGVGLFFLGGKLINVCQGLVMKLPTIYWSLIEPEIQGIFQVVEGYVSKLDPNVVLVLNQWATSILQSLGGFVSGLSVKIMAVISGFASALPGIFLKVVITIIVTFFLAIDFKLVTGFLVKQLPKRAMALLQETKHYVTGTLFKCIGAYILILSITFMELAIGLTLLGIPHAWVIALCIAVFDILPVVGTGGIMIPWAVISFICRDIGLGVGLLMVYVVITVVRNILEPKLVGHQVGLHPVVTLACMFVGLQLFGIIGLFGLPITCSFLKQLNDQGVIHLLK